MREVKKGQKYIHFKGGEVIILEIALHSETKEKMVVYTHEGQTWVRPYEMFISEVDHEKYPDVKQKYRFELVSEE